MQKQGSMHSFWSSKAELLEPSMLFLQPVNSP